MICIVLAMHFSNVKRTGCNYFNGGFVMDRLWFGGFQSSPYYKMSALGGGKCRPLGAALFQHVSNMKFGFDDSVCINNILLLYY